MIIAVTGLTREARIVAGAGVNVLCCGGRSTLLREKLERALAKNTAGIISIGIAGGLAPLLKSGDCVIASEIVSESQHIPTDASWTQRLAARLPDVFVAPLASSEGIVFGQTSKADLFRATGAYAVDMESHVAARFAGKHRVPFAALRAIADQAESELPRLVSGAITSTGTVDLLGVLKAVLSDPRQISALIRTARESNAAFQALLRCRNILGPGLAGPDGSELALDM
jgi:adenosylhomocysteine nucleosidase